jgi:hypothetical protein
MRAKPTKGFNQQAVIASNPKIDRRLVEQFSALEEQLRKLGVDTRPKYTLSPPLGEFSLFNSSCGTGES